MALAIHYPIISPLIRIPQKCFNEFMKNIRMNGVCVAGRTLGENAKSALEWLMSPFLGFSRNLYPFEIKVGQKINPLHQVSVIFRRDTETMETSVCSLTTVAVILLWIKVARKNIVNKQKIKCCQLRTPKEIVFLISFFEQLEYHQPSLITVEHLAWELPDIYL